jgi:hypothetical protein
MKKTLEQTSKDKLKKLKEDINNLSNKEIDNSVFELNIALWKLYF